MLAVEGLNAWWGHAQALFDVHLQVGEGELVVLQGLNGAGKSTLLQALIGIGPRVQGSIVWDGQAIGHWPAHRRARAGLGFVAEDRRLFTGLSVQDNLWIAADARAAGAALHVPRAEDEVSQHRHLVRVERERVFAGVFPSDSENLD